MKLTRDERERLERIKDEVRVDRKPVPLRIYPDDAIFLIVLIERLLKAINDSSPSS